jgi:PsbP
MKILLSSWVLFFALIVNVGSISSSYLSYGQTESNVSDSGEQFNMMDKKSTSRNTLTGYSNYNGSKFSFQYPSDWSVVPNALGPGPHGSESLWIQNYNIPARILLFIGQDTETPSNVTQDNVKSHLEQMFPSLVKGMISVFKQSTLTELDSPVYDKYIIDGHKAASTNFKTTNGQLHLKNVVVATIANGNIFGLVFGAPEDVYDQNLPTFDNIVKSVLLRNSAESNSNPELTNYKVLNDTHFSLQYPADWNEEKVSLGLLGYYYRITGDQYKTGFVDVQALTCPQSCMHQYGLPENMTQSQIESNLETIFPKLGVGSQPSQMGEPRYDKYTIDGHKAGSVLLTEDYGNIVIKKLLIGTLIGNDWIGFAYSAPVSVFDQNISIMENMVKSFKLSPKV